LHILTSDYLAWFVSFSLLLHANKVLFLVLSVTCFFLFVTQISWERLNGFMPNSREDMIRPALRRVWMSKSGQGHQGQKICLALPSPPRQRTNGMHSLKTACSSSGWHHSVAARGVISGACVRVCLVKRL